MAADGQFPAEQLADSIGPIERVCSVRPGLWRVSTKSDEFAVKIGTQTRSEADGLSCLGSLVGAPRVPNVVLAYGDLLVTQWVHQAPRADSHLRSLGRGLAALHSNTWSGWGGGSAWIGNCEVDTASLEDGATFYGRRLVELGRRCALDRQAESVAARLGELVPFGAPSLVHGDLWWGNVLWGVEGAAWLIDPSVHGGHPEEDLAMLALFGPVPESVFAAYAEVSTLDDGWENRVRLFQLYPLLVHAVLFGEGYRQSAAAILESLS